MLLRALSLLLVTAVMAGCATSKHWSVTNGGKDAGVVRVYYEYPEFRDPALGEDQAATLALERCRGWGYDAAEPIPGQIRQCSNMQGGDCDLWRVTREYQCTNGVSFADTLAR